ncbi:MAG: hypothetical protein K6G62_02660 [Eubacterium sp.]|nr:hypothetical protein [Eubacterium sp.]
MAADKVLDRRFEMCTYILQKRVTHYSDLMKKFHISKPTAASDVAFISKYLLSLETKDGVAGYIKVLETGLRASLIKLCYEDASTLIDFYKALAEKDMEVIMDEHDKILDVLDKVIKMIVMPQDLQQRIDECN